MTTAMEGNFFHGVPVEEATLYVPEASLDSYKATSPWSRFGTILPITSSSIETNTSASSANIDAIYNLEGKRTNCLNRGINIVHMSDGTTKKVIR